MKENLVSYLFLVSLSGSLYQTPGKKSRVFGGRKDGLPSCLCKVRLLEPDPEPPRTATPSGPGCYGNLL